MTCIVGFIDKNKDLWMGADSLGSNNSIKTERKDTKLFYNNQFLIGYTTSFRMGQILRYKWNSPKNVNKKDDYEFMCTDVIDSIRECFKENDYENGEFLIGYNNRLYTIEEDFQIAEQVDKFASCGSGCYFAIGAMNILKNITDGKNACKMALETASKYNPFVGGSLKIIKYKGLK